MTNFHLPKSTLMMLVSALMGRVANQAIYAHAMAERYRFFSYGDASLLIPSATNDTEVHRADRLGREWLRLVARHVYGPGHSRGEVDVSGIVGRLGALSGHDAACRSATACRALFLVFAG